MTIEEAKKRLVEATLHHMHGDISKAAALLGVNRTTIYIMIERYGISRWG